MIFLGLGASLLILQEGSTETSFYLPSSPDDKSDFGFGLDIKVSVGFSRSMGIDRVEICFGVLISILLSIDCCAFP